MKVNTLLDQIDLGAIALPEFQRGYVWNRDQVRQFMQSMYRRFPVGSLLVWATRSETANYRGDGSLTPGVVKLLLDGQQRITSLYGIIRNKPPEFFDGNFHAFTGLYFNLDEEVFEFYAPLKMKDNPLWVNVTELMQKGVGPYITNILENDNLKGLIQQYINRLNAVVGIRDIVFHVDEVTGEDKTIDIVVDIFNLVNSGGTKLSKGDLALAKICAEWPEARNQMKGHLKVWADAGFDFSLDWLLRNTNVLLTSESRFHALKGKTIIEFQEMLETVVKITNYLINMISGRLGLDHDRVLAGRYAFPIMAYYLSKNNGKVKDGRDRDKLLYWYVHSFLWGRFAGSVEGILNQDIAAIDKEGEPLDNLISLLSSWRGDLTVRPEHFAGWSLGSRFYPMLYLLTRVCSSQDFGTGLPLTAYLLGKINALQVHHIFPKSILYKNGYGKAEVNAVANYCFLTQDTNLKISDKEPRVYLEEIESKHPGALHSQWIPLDRNLWKIENYNDFLIERRKLLADAANSFLNGLLTGTSFQAQPVEYSTALTHGVPPRIDIDEELMDLLLWFEDNNIPIPEVNFEINDPDTGENLTMVELAWPNGLQEGYSKPLALILETNSDSKVILNQAGYTFFDTIDALKQHIREYSDQRQ